MLVRERRTLIKEKLRTTILEAFEERGAMNLVELTLYVNKKGMHMNYKYVLQPMIVSKLITPI